MSGEISRAKDRLEKPFMASLKRCVNHELNDLAKVEGDSYSFSRRIRFD
jgi:hypothetical protein